MPLPEALKLAIDKQVEKIPLRELEACAKELSLRYHRQSHPAYMTSQGHRLAYLATRLPATYAAIHYVLAEIKRSLPSLSLYSVLDLGSGPGTGFWACSEQFDTLKKTTLYERDPQLISLGKELIENAPCSIDWIQADLQNALVFEPHDLVLLSYAWGELPEKIWPELMKKIWEATKEILVIIEPGTPQGFERMRHARELLISLGGFLIAPCPHSKKCPMSKTDWCHFSTRLERSFSHRFLKSARLNYEDEKFSYVVFSKNPYLNKIEARILRTPLKRTGHVALTLCTLEGIKNKIVTRKEKETYRGARKAEWGDTLIESK